MLEAVKERIFKREFAELPRVVFFLSDLQSAFAVIGQRQSRPKHLAFYSAVVDRDSVIIQCESHGSINRRSVYNRSKRLAFTHERELVRRRISGNLPARFNIALHLHSQPFEDWPRRTLRTLSHPIEIGCRDSV